MYPRQHAVVSGAATLLYAVITSVSPVEIVLWTIIGVIAGVLIDVDHVILSMLVAHRVEEGISWFKRPVQAITSPDDLLEDMEYESLVFHRMISHGLVLVILIVLTRVHVLFLPAVIGLTAHILADILWDLKQGSYGI